MPGPEPKSNRVRRGTPVKESQRIYLPPDGRKGRAPAMPTGEKVLKATREQWAAWWRSPMATQWRKSEDVYPLCRLALLYDEERRYGVDAKRSAEMRQLEARFGLEPRSRKELCWVIGDSEPAPAGRARVADELEERRARAERIAAGE